jgi:hypothetical protein
MWGFEFASSTKKRVFLVLDWGIMYRTQWQRLGRAHMEHQISRCLVLLRRNEEPVKDRYSGLVG